MADLAALMRAGVQRYSQWLASLEEHTAGHQDISRLSRSEHDAHGRPVFKRGWFGAKVRIRVKSMKLLADLPSCDHGEVTLHVARRDRDQAAAFVQMLG